MSFVSVLCEKLKYVIFNEGFDTEYRNTTTKTIFILYCLSGGFYYHHNVRKGFRKFWICFNVFCCVLINVACIHYWFNAPVYDFYALLIPAPTMIGILGEFSIQLWAFLKPDAFSKLILFLDDENNTPAAEMAKCARRIRNSNHDFINDTVMDSDQKKSGNTRFVIVALQYSMIGLIITLALNNYERYVKFDNYVIAHYPMYTPWDNFTIRIIIWIVQSITVMPIAMKYISLIALIFIITAEINDRFEGLRRFLRDASDSLAQCIDEVWQLELAMEENRVPSSLSKIQELKIKRAMARDQFVEKTIVVIKTHQKLFSATKLYANTVQSIMSPLYLITSSVAIDIAFFASSITETDQILRSVPHILILFAAILGWFVCCFTAEMVRNMNEIIASEVYNSSWYLLEPKDRRLILTFLTILERPISICVYGSYRACLSSFPDLLDTMYNQVKILRSLQINKTSA